MNSLYLLSLLLTAKHDEAEKCFVCSSENSAENVASCRRVGSLLGSTHDYRRAAGTFYTGRTTLLCYLHLERLDRVNTKAATGLARSHVAQWPEKAASTC